VTWLRLAAGLSLSTLGTLGLGALGVPAAPDLFLLPVADAARRSGAPLAMIAGLLAGLLEDLVSVPGRLLGLHAFTKVLAGYLLAAVAARTVVEKPVSVGGLLAGTVLVESLALVLLLWILRGEAVVPPPLVLLSRAAATGLLAGALQAAQRVPWRERRAARRRMKLG
jgi:rod shape-determining protein MreD